MILHGLKNLDKWFDLIDQSIDWIVYVKGTMMTSRKRMLVIPVKLHFLGLKHSSNNWGLMSTGIYPQFSNLVFLIFMFSSYLACYLAIHVIHEGSGKWIVSVPDICWWLLTLFDLFIYSLFFLKYVKLLIFSRQTFTLDYPLANSSFTGSNVYAILRAPKVTIIKN